MIIISCGLSLCVVPVFVTAGSAVLPALIGALTTVFATLLSPRKLWQFIKTHPIGVCVGVISTGIFIFLFHWWWTLSSNPTRTSPSASSSKEEEGKYWCKVAEAILNNQNSSISPEGSTNSLLVIDRLSNLEKKIDLLIYRLEQSSISIQGVSVNPSQGVSSSGESVSTTQNEKKQGPGPLIFRVNEFRNGYIGGTSPIKLKKKWDYYEDGLMFWSSPLFFGKRVYGAWCYLDPPKTYGGIVCLDIESGKKIWEIDKHLNGVELKGIFSSPALTQDGQLLVIGEGLHPDYDSALICINTQQGKILWTFPTPLHIESSPVIFENLVIAGVGAVEGPDRKPRSHRDPQKDRHPGMIIAVDLATGKLVWQQTVNDPESSPVILGDIVIIGSGFNGNALVAFSAHNGEKRWSVPTPYPAIGAVTVGNENVVVIGCGNSDYVVTDPNPRGVLMGVQPQTGTVLWTIDFPDSILASPAIYENKMVVPVRNGLLTAWELHGTEKPRKLWEIVLRKQSKLLGGAALTSSTAYIITNDGYLFLIDVQSGQVIGSYYVNKKPGELGMCIAGPIITPFGIILGTETGGLQCWIEEKEVK